jgi:hypothetical protein
MVYFVGQPAERSIGMFDELDLLRDDARLRELLSHYSLLAQANPEAWQDRLMQMAGAEPRDLVHLHGLLLAFGWIDQNTGQAFTSKEGTFRSCYRVTPSGERVLRQIQGSVASGGEATFNAKPEKPALRFSKKKREGPSSPASIAVTSAK